MAMAKKGTRVIVVDGERYRWVVAPNDEPGLAIVVLHADVDGQRMVTWVEHGVVVAPGLVAGAVRDALLHHGWTPRLRGRQLTLRCLGRNPNPADLRLVAWPPTA
ncbi:hypothetical protein [Streptomyces kaniharaensis]|uniref:hypothetical protein n=1 Tax=Streptomyces kaniharaensis TaxID=212423 RepID=UPI0012957B82|nr:hypothetical protein [Streptomyces kaniharaensis]